MAGGTEAAREASAVAREASPIVWLPRRHSARFSQQQEALLRGHGIAALATGRHDGSPQLSHGVHEWDGSRILISLKSYTAKWNNARRQPPAALLVHEDRTQLVVYGQAEGTSDDPQRSELAARVFTDRSEAGSWGSAPLELSQPWSGARPARRRLGGSPDASPPAGCFAHPSARSLPFGVRGVRMGRG